MVNLQDFVRDSLVQVVAGVKEAATIASESGATVNPGVIARDQDVRAKIGRDWVPVQSIEFDIAVVAAEGTADEGKVGFFVSVVGGTLASKAETSNQITSRLRFTVPVVLPLGSEARPS